MRTFLFTLFSFFSCSIGFAQAYWQTNKSKDKPTFTLQEQVFAQVLQTIPEENVHRDMVDYAGLVSLPNPEGEIKDYYLVSYVLQPGDSKTMHPGRIAYHGYGVKEQGDQVEFLMDQKGVYAVFNTNRHLQVLHKTEKTPYLFEELRGGKFDCGTTNHTESLPTSFAYTPYVSVPAHHQYRIAIATIEEVTQSQGSAGTSSYISQQVIGFNSFYRAELGITFTLVSGNDALITPANDGHQRYSSPAIVTQSATWYGENKANIHNQGFSLSDYDIGLLIAEPPAAQFAAGASENSSVCDDDKKAFCWIGVNAPGVPFLLRALHELGHKLSATHTFNSISNNASCSSARTEFTAFEPGAGSTVMSYAQNCDAADEVVAVRQSVFHTANLLQISQFVTTGQGGSCGTHTPLSDTPPLFTFKGLDNLSIPVFTNVELKAKAYDPQFDPILYAWDEIDKVTSPTPLPPSLVDGNAPCNLSMVMPPGVSKRTLKAGTGTNATIGTGYVPTYERDLTFAVTLRSTHNGFGAFNTDKVQIHTKNIINNFKITYPSGPDHRFLQGSQVILKWDNSVSQPPFSVQGVRILFSTDNGTNWNFDLGTSLNDGEEVVSLPYDLTATGRFRIDALDNLFFTISDEPFSIVETCHGYSNSLSTTSQNSFISKVQFLDIINASTFNAPESYSLFNQAVPSIVAGDSTLLSVTVSGEPQGIGVWLDINGDALFNGPEELLKLSTNPVLGTFSFKFAFPQLTTSEGSRTLRIRTKANGIFTESDFCTFVSLGETEDYVILVTPGIDMDGYCRPTNNGNCPGGDCLFYVDGTPFKGPTGYSGVYVDLNSISPGVIKQFTMSRYDNAVTTSEYHVSVTADLNEDGDFTDANELLFQSAAKSNVHNISINISNIPVPRQKRFRFWAYAEEHGQISFDCSAPINGVAHDRILWIGLPESCPLGSPNPNYTETIEAIRTTLSCCDINQSPVTIEVQNNLFLFGVLASLVGGPGNLVEFPYEPTNQKVERKYMLNHKYPNASNYSYPAIHRRATLTQGSIIKAKLRVDRYWSHECMGGGQSLPQGMAQIVGIMTVAATVNLYHHALELKVLNQMLVTSEFSLT